MRSVAVALTAGTLLGATDSVVNHIPAIFDEVGTARADRGGWFQAAEFASLILDAGWGWAATAVLVGWLVSTSGLARAALAGGLALACASSVYYGVDLLFDGGSWWGWVTRFWLIGSVLLGPPLGAVGALIRRPGPIGTVAALVVPAGAALQMVLLPPASESRMAQPVQVSVWIAAAAATATVVVWNYRRRAVALHTEQI
ncbi:MAG: DUF6518 family protein [Actinoplanes sp.]